MNTRLVVTVAVLLMTSLVVEGLYTYAEVAKSYMASCDETCYDYQPKGQSCTSYGGGYFSRSCSCQCQVKNANSY